MQIKGSVNSRGFKKGASAKIAEILKVRHCLTEFVGRLELDATCAQDIALLTMLFDVLQGADYGGGGTIKVINKKNETGTFTLPTTKEVTCSSDAVSGQSSESSPTP
jgi:hypothetical protein